ncbi:unnamed protein product, partial [Ectocarpus fasciculatus]
MPRIDTDVKLDFKDVLIRPKRSTLKSRSEVELERSYVFRNSKREWTGVPIMAANMDTVGTFEIAKAFAASKMVTCIHKHYSVSDWEEFAAANAAALPFVGVSCGTGNHDFHKAGSILAVADVPFVCLDVANGYTEFFVDHVRKVREAHPRVTIIAGNVVTGEMTEELIISGADIVKVRFILGWNRARYIRAIKLVFAAFMMWIPDTVGSVCTTRRQTGVGYPQLSAVLECADAAHGLGGHVVSDGGCTCPGDFSKAFGAGGDFVMAGGMFAGHEESGGELVEGVDGNMYKEFYGECMSSAVAMTKHSGGVAPYRSSEGKVVSIPFRGPISATINDILGGIRSSCTYVGASKLKELTKRTTFIRVTQQINEVF